MLGLTSVFILGTSAGLLFPVTGWWTVGMMCIAGLAAGYAGVTAGGGSLSNLTVIACVLIVSWWGASRPVCAPAESSLPAMPSASTKSYCVNMSVKLKIAFSHLVSKLTPNGVPIISGMLITMGFVPPTSIKNRCDSVQSMFFHAN